MKLKLYILLFFTTSLFAQKVTTSIDSTQKKIGAEFKLTLKTEVDTLTKVSFPNPQFIGNLEVIQSYKIDTVKKGSRHELIKKYGLTQFDSGKYFISRLPIMINGKPVFSDSLNVEVKEVVVDTLKQKMYDIKDIAPEKAQSNWWMYVVGLLLFGLLVFGVYRFLKNRPKKEKKVVIEYKTPIEKATSLLQQLEQKELWQKGEVKSYYSELTDIARNYIEEEIHIPAMESTTSELIVSLRNVAKNKKLKLSKETLENLEKVLMQADLVKFAKVKPLDFEIEEDKKRITSTIVTIHKAIPEVVEDKDELDDWNEQQKEKARLKRLKKERQKKFIYAGGLVAGLLISTLLYFIATKGFVDVKDTILRNPSKILLENEWIKSDYGNPGVIVETPEVLRRMDPKKALSKDAFAILKEMQMFNFGSLYEPLYVEVSALKYKKETDVNFDTVLEGITKNWEKIGAQNILFKQEDFNTGKGVTGARAYGSMTVVDKENDESEKMYYEILLFKQDGGLQQIIVSHRDGDKYGDAILQRIIKSAELKQAQ